MAHCTKADMAVQCKYGGGRHLGIFIGRIQVSWAGQDRVVYKMNAKLHAER